jgi:histidinol dehydrogenase
MLTTKVAKMLDDVRRRGDGAVRAALRRFDGLMGPLVVAGSGFPNHGRFETVARGTPAHVGAVRQTYSRLSRGRASTQSPVLERAFGGPGWARNVRPVDSVGAYVPGGRFAYPSTVLMTCIPARVAGVRRVVVCTPPRHLHRRGHGRGRVGGSVDEFFRIGGVAAVGALAYGTATVQPVDLIVGPGGAWVTEAKRQVFGTVGIDMLAGPSEIVILADRSAPADWVAADMMAQAEHDPLARSTLIALEARVLAA